jgi:WD40 repeat protein
MFASALRWLLVVLLLVTPPLAFGQAKRGRAARPKIGDKVKVEWAGEEKEAEVVGYSATGWITVKFKSNGLELTPTLPPEQLKPVEKKTAAAAGAGLHTWVDVTGKYKTEATFLRLADGKVELKKADGSIAKVPLDKLSAADQELAKKLAEADAAAGRDPNDPFATTEPAEPGTPAEPAEPAPAQPANHTDTQNPANLKVTEPNRQGESEVLLDESVREGGLTADPEPANPISLASRGIPLSKTATGKEGLAGGFFEHPKVIAIPPSGGKAVVALVDELPSTERVTRLERCDLAAGKSLGSTLLNGNSVPLDADPTGQFIVARSDNFHIGTHGRVDIFDISESQLKHVISWLPYGDRDWGQRDVQFASFLDNGHICTVDGGRADRVAGRSGQGALFRGNFQGPTPAISGTGKYLAVLTKGGIYVLDALTGNPLAKFAGQPGYFPRLSFRPDGQQLACVSSGMIQVWDVKSGQMVHDVYLPTQFAANTVAWPSDGYMLLNGGSLVDLTRRIVLWQYSGGSEVGATVNGRQLFVAKSGDQSGTLVHTPLPHGDAKKLAASLEPDALLAIKPGVQVSVRIAVAMTPQEQQQIYDALVKRLTDNGVEIVQNANVILHATTEQGETKTVEYRTIGRGFGTESATVTQQIQKLTFTENGKTLWQAVQVKDAPFFLHTGGKDLNAAVAAQTRPDMAFFTNMVLPKHLARPGPLVGGAYGAANLTPQGVQ